MQEIRWCLKVHRSDGEVTRKELITRGILDRTGKIRLDGDFLLIPLIEQIEGAENEIFVCTPPEEKLPRFEHIGGIAIMRDDNINEAKIILAHRPGIHTVLYPESPVSGQYRTKEFKILAGEDTTATIVTEYGHKFYVDLKAAYFSARLSGERQRIFKLMREGERVIDMFAGVGPFAITLAEKGGVVYASDINPDAVSLMIKNISFNNVTNVIPILADAINLSAFITTKVDRIIMNLPLNPLPFMETAFRLVRTGGIIHLYSLVSREDEYIDALNNFPVSSINIRYVRSYSPDRFHVVYDILRG
jgi:tRNA (guanine37-N1)-methyltransferase